MSVVTNLDELLRQLTQKKTAAPPTPSPANRPVAETHRAPATPLSSPSRPFTLKPKPQSPEDTAPAMPALTKFAAPTSTEASLDSDLQHLEVSTSSAKLTDGLAVGSAVAGNSPAFIPQAPKDLSGAGLNASEVTSIILKFLLNTGVESGYRTAGQLGLRFPIVEALLRDLKTEKLLIYKNSVAGGDYVYELTDLGRERARSLYAHCSYYGAAPVPLKQYIASVSAQSLTLRRPTLQEIRKAFADLSLNEQLIRDVGQAIHSGRGMFMYGAAGNGKTSIASRISRAFGDSIWIPRAISAGGEIVRLYDPHRHELIPDVEVSVNGNDPTDGRWVHIHRPSVVVGGELQMENLEITIIRGSGIGEAPLQLKANCGTLLIDDFGRQRMRTDDLLNRWIVPLENRHDYLHLESGRTIQVPFDQLLIFSTNLQPKDLVDEAFLRRIPYKIEVLSPTEVEFRALFLDSAVKLGFECTSSSVDYLMEKHYRFSNRPMRFCHPRDILRQVENYCTLLETEKVVTKENLDRAVANYFSIM